MTRRFLQLLHLMHLRLAVQDLGPWITFLRLASEPCATLFSNQAALKSLASDSPLQLEKNYQTGALNSSTIWILDPAEGFGCSE